MQKELKSGYTTGTHATAVVTAVLLEYMQNEIADSLEIMLPKEKKADIKVQRCSRNHFSTIKVDNDDLDVTKGCCIHAELFLQAPQGLKKQVPTCLEVHDSKIFLYAGEGVGVATKKGLSIGIDSPAINPTPCSMMQNMARTIIGAHKEALHIVISVENGKEIAKQTANAKVGVLGGISILGTRGIVKPISADAYLDSIATEIAVADANGVKNIVFTLGNTSQDYALKHYDEEQVVEVGNFVYEASERLLNTSLEKMTFISGSGKLCKIAQGCKNTHNRFGTIDFDLLKTWVLEELEVDIRDEDFRMLKAVLQTLTQSQVKQFVRFLNYKAGTHFLQWFEDLGVRIQTIEIITLQGDDVIRKEIQW
ncbi:cobalt-precorrin-5B (C(1))-methyltransferase [Sulfurimonas sp. SAG-AH-194-I05]|nr:cobalt-precorrin-5B (C(1))-methyltransferase CbiD [Sulfurimonas sp. SAG-AH-194-I05]MDF1875303.1 cobalt-precorrin-5B (C(1))-methyltransferase [Sulfurimonas sp. SAG-AH-194-I05]